MATPTLIIGLGGTGLKAATHIKKNLLEANRNVLPRETAIMVLDTERAVKYVAGGWGQERGAEHATGPVKIETGEYIAMVGNVRAVVEAIRQEQQQGQANPAARRNQAYQHINSWFQATYYLNDANLPSQVLNLEEGAGQYRQFGRLALFRNIEKIEQKLKSSISAIQRANAASALHVHLIGSLAGGTGASLFADVAHLVQLIVRDVGYNSDPVLLGHFVLTEAFRGTREVKLNESGVLQNFNARMYAALRELTRLQSSIIPRSGGYPIYYDPQGTGTRKALLQVKPYNAVYLYDGVAERIQLNQRPVENGVAPAIADIVTAYIDEKSGGAFRSHSVNYDAFYSAYNVPSGAVTFGSVGVYTIELPIYHITEGWAHRLAADVLNALLLPDPTAIDNDTGVPSRLMATTPGDRTVAPQTEAQNWLQMNTTSLVAKIAEWGRRATTMTNQIRDQVARDILALSAESWQVELAPTDTQFAHYVAEAQSVLTGSLTDKNSTNYYVDLNQGSGSNQEKALNLQREVDDRLRRMVGNSVDVWKREGGDFRDALVRLGNHHVNEFDSALIRFVRETLNGTTVGNALVQKQGKLGFVLAFLAQLEGLLSGGATTLALADKQSQAYRRPQFDGYDGERRAAFARMQQGGGVLSNPAKIYRDKTNELAQFHKADIARQVVYDLAVRLHKGVRQLLDEARLWERALATSIAENGGAYALIRRGQAEVESDRRQSENAARWIISDDEPGDHYMADKYERYAAGQLEEVLSRVEWRVGRVDGAGALRIDFALGEGQPWSREPGQSGAMPAGRRNVSRLLALCRAPFTQAWDDMSVTSYLYQNFYQEANQLDLLAKRIHENSGYLLDLSALSKGPTMRTAFVRVYQDKLDNRGEAFLRELRAAVDTRFDVTTSAEQRESSQPTTAGPIKGYISDKGQPSTDPFKISFLIYGDLLLPKDIKAFEDGRVAYQTFSGMGEQWRTLQVFPAETNALEIERELDNASPTSEGLTQTRREFDPDVVTVMEDKGNFETAMRCLAYGDRDYRWNIGNRTGLLLHEHTPLENNESGLSYWRLVVMPAGSRGADGTLYDTRGGVAQPLEYQLTAWEAEPSLLDAFVQLVSRQRDARTGTPIDWIRVEETLRQVMAWHRDQWASVEAMGWQLLPNQNDHVGQELKDKVAQLVRLNALHAWLDDRLNEHKWAWVKGSDQMPPRVANNPERQVKIRKQVDMWTAVRGAANQGVERLQRRLRLIGVNRGTTPQEMLRLTTPFRRDPDEAPSTPATPETPAARWLPDGTWQCGQGHYNAADDAFCGYCGQPRPELPTPPAAPPAVPPTPPAPPMPVAPAVATIRCVNGHEMQPDWQLCPYCGAQPAPQSDAITCLNGHEMQPGWKLCPFCGAPPR